MGTHLSNPSKDLTTGRSLLDLVQENQMLLSPSIAKRFEDRLPFLFKVLSINKALSIQAHPNKQLAEKLHSKDAKNYPDDNHKPEMTIAITPFEGLCGFRPLEEIRHFLRNVPSLRELVGDEESQAFEEAIEGHGASEQGKKKALKHAFTSLMESTSEEVGSQAKLLIKQAKDEGEKFAGGGVEGSNGKELSELMVRLNGQFPNDIGLFVTFFLNYVQLLPGEAMFLKADDIHAYLSGGKSTRTHPAQNNSPTLTTSSLLRRHHGMHGQQRQCRPRRLHPEIQGRANPDHHAHLLFRANL